MHVSIVVQCDNDESTYKFEGPFFRHERRIATKFGTHVRIETRLALT